MPLGVALAASHASSDAVILSPAQFRVSHRPFARGVFGSALGGTRNRFLWGRESVSQLPSLLISVSIWGIRDPRLAPRGGVAQAPNRPQWRGRLRPARLPGPGGWGQRPGPEVAAQVPAAAAKDTPSRGGACAAGRAQAPGRRRRRFPRQREATVPAPPVCQPRRRRRRHVHGRGGRARRPAIPAEAAAREGGEAGLSPRLRGTPGCRRASSTCRRCGLRFREQAPALPPPRKLVRGTALPSCAPALSSRRPHCCLGGWTHLPQARGGRAERMNAVDAHWEPERV